MLHSTSGLPDTSKPSNAMSGVILILTDWSEFFVGYAASRSVWFFGDNWRSLGCHLAFTNTRAFAKRKTSPPSTARTDFMGHPLSPLHLRCRSQVCVKY
jgi:hypothetical protein